VHTVSSWSRAGELCGRHHPEQAPVTCALSHDSAPLLVLQGASPGQPVSRASCGAPFQARLLPQPASCCVLFCRAPHMCADVHAPAHTTGGTMGSMGDYGQFNTSAVPCSVDIMGFSCRHALSSCPA
jgi:hypothetical protein